MSDFEQALKKLDPEILIDDLGYDYRRQMGRSGEQINIRECPRCGGDKWKVFLNSETGLGNCFHGSCVGQPGFNLFSFAKHATGSTTEAFKTIERLTGKLGWMPKKKKEKKEDSKYRDLDQTKVVLPRSVPLPYKGSVGKYLSSRGFDAETVDKFGWRYSQRGVFGYKYNDEICYQSYAKRIIIPILDLDGQLATFQGRDVTGEEEKKYLFPPGLPGTSLYLYNGHNAIGSDELVLNEGALDVAATYQAFKEDPTLANTPVAGTFGKNLSFGRLDGEDQLGALIKLKLLGLKTVTLMWDGERKAISDAINAAFMLIRHGFKARVAILPDGKDPNEATPVEVRSAYRNAYAINSKLDLLKIKSKHLLT